MVAKIIAILMFLGRFGRVLGFLGQVLGALGGVLEGVGIKMIFGDALRDILDAFWRP